MNQQNYSTKDTKLEESDVNISADSINLGVGDDLKKKNAVIFFLIGAVLVLLAITVGTLYQLNTAREITIVTSDAVPNQATPTQLDDTLIEEASETTVEPDASRQDDDNPTSNAQPTSEPPNNSSTLSPGVFYPFSDGVTINNTLPTIAGKIAQTGTSYLATSYIKEKSVISGEETQFLRYIAGKVENLEVSVDGKVVPIVYGFAQYPTVTCHKTNDLSGDQGEAYPSKEDCLLAKKDELPPLIFFLKPSQALTPGEHQLSVSDNGQAFEEMTFTVDPNFSLAAQTVVKPDENDPKRAPYQLVYGPDSCGRGYYYGSEVVHLPLSRGNNTNLFLGASFPQTAEESGSIKRRKAQIGFDGKLFDLFFPQASVFYQQALDTLSPSQTLFLPVNNLYFTDGKSVKIQEVPSDYMGYEYFELYPVDISGREYRGYSIPWLTSGWSGCDG